MEEGVSLPPAFPSGDKALATPAVRRIAAEHNVDLKNVQGTGKEGRVLKEDILAYVSGMKSQPAAAKPVKAAAPSPPTPSGPPPPPAILPPLVSKALPDKKEPIKGYTRTMIKTMTAANVMEKCTFTI